MIANITIISTIKSINYKKMKHTRKFMWKTEEIPMVDSVTRKTRIVCILITKLIKISQY